LQVTRLHFVSARSRRSQRRRRTGCRLQVLSSEAQTHHQQLGRKGKYGHSRAIRGSGSVAGSQAGTSHSLSAFKSAGILSRLGTPTTDSSGGSFNHVQHCRRIRTRQQKGVHTFFNRGQGIERRSSFPTLRRLRPGIFERSGIQFHAQLSGLAFSKAVDFHPLSGNVSRQCTVADPGNRTFVKSGTAKRQKAESLRNEAWGTGREETLRRTSRKPVTCPPPPLAPARPRRNEVKAGNL